MHSMNRNADGTYCVGRVEIYAQSYTGSVFVPMFDHLKLYEAIDLVSALNGGPGNLGSRIDQPLMGREVGGRP